MKKNRLAILAIATTLVIGGTIMTVQNKSLITEDIFGFKSPREKQLTYLKKHEKDIEECGKSLSRKVKSLKLYWTSI